MQKRTTSIYFPSLTITYINIRYLNKFSISFCWTSLSITIGCWHGFALSSFRKYGLQAERTTLWAVNEQPSQANVTSTKSSSSRRCRKEERMEDWKSFQRRAYCCSGEVSPPIGQSEGAISTPMVEPFRHHVVTATVGCSSHFVVAYSYGLIVKSSFECAAVLRISCCRCLLDGGE